MIYFVRSHTTGHIKIGYTADIDHRMNSLRSQYGEFDMLGIMKGTLQDERQLHKQFTHLNVEDFQYGWEWFLETQELTDYIKQSTIEYSKIAQNIEPLIPPIEIALGPSRAQILLALQTPLNTGELACKLCVSAGAISQHLKNLQLAGLIESIRNGKYVYHRLTSRGQKLIDVFLE